MVADVLLTIMNINVTIVGFKPKTVIGRVVNTNPSASHTHKNHGGNYWFKEGDWTNPISPFTLIKIT